MHWHECPFCAIRYGTGTSVAPGRTCRNCGWEAPGKSGEDQRAVAKMERDDVFKEIERQAKKRRAQVLHTCRVCGKRLKNEHGRVQHERQAHTPEKLAAVKPIRELLDTLKEPKP